MVLQTLCCQSPQLLISQVGILTSLYSSNSSNGDTWRRAHVSGNSI